MGSLLLQNQKSVEILDWPEILKLHLERFLHIDKQPINYYTFPPWELPMNDEETQRVIRSQRKFKRHSHSDFQVLYKVYCSFIEKYEKHQFCIDEHLSFRAMNTAKGVYRMLKSRMNDLQYAHAKCGEAYASVNKSQMHWCLINMCMTASLFPNLCLVEGDVNAGASSLKI